MDILYPVEFANPSCIDDYGERTKACHGAEGGWVRGQKLGNNDFGTWVSKAYGSFYTTGSIPENKDYSLSTWAGKKNPGRQSWLYILRYGIQRLESDLERKMGWWIWYPTRRL